MADTDLDEAERWARHLVTSKFQPPGPALDRLRRLLEEYDRRAQEIEQVTYERDEALARVAAAEAVQGRMADSLPADGPWELWGHRDRAVREYEGELSAALAVEVDPLADRRVETEPPSTGRRLAMPEKNVGSWSETEEMRRSLCKALAIHPDTTWEEAIENARGAGIVRDAEYRHCDRVDERNRVLSSLLRGMARRVGLVRRMGRECAADLRDYDAEIIRLLGTVAAVRALADEWRREAKQWSGLAKTPATTMAATLLSKHADEVLRELDGADSATDTPRGDDEPLHEVQCPNCDATIRARMADAPTPREDDTPAPTPTDDEAPVLAGAAPATVIETVALTLEQLSEPTMVHGKWILAQMARDLRRVLNDLAAEAGTPAQPDVSVICDDMGGPHGVGGPCVLQPGHPHVDGIGGVWPATDALVTEMVARISAGQRLLPWPELTQDLAFIAMVIESAAGSVSTTPDPAAILRAAAAGRREYASGTPADTADALELQAATLDQAAEIVSGDYRALYGWLPSWRWTRGMTDRLHDGSALAGADVAALAGNTTEEQP